MKLIWIAKSRVIRGSIPFGAKEVDRNPKPVRGGVRVTATSLCFRVPSAIKESTTTLRLLFLGGCLKSGDLIPHHQALLDLALMIGEPVAGYAA